MQTQADSVNAVPPQQRIAAVVRAAGVDQFFRQRGMPGARVDACLADTNAIQEQIAASQRAGEADGVTGTPTFVINGRVAENVGNWRHPDPNRALEPRLRAAIGG